MYMNISEFRKDLSKHFNEAVQGRPVFITRSGQMFKLEAYIPTKEEQFVRISALPPEPKQETIDTRAVRVNAIKHGFNSLNVNICPHGYGKGMCKKADCNKKFRED